jgi:hypothetical protein
MNSDQFTRRAVSHALVASTWTIALSPLQAMARRNIPLFDFAIAGGWYHGLDDVRDSLAVNEKLRLRAEPGNPHDANAVAVHRANGLMLGYIPRVANAPIARLLADGATIDANIVGRLIFDRQTDIPEDFAWTGFISGDPRVRLTRRN